ncbi:MAG: DUF6069 family protein [Pseudonocardia sp.]
MPGRDDSSMDDTWVGGRPVDTGPVVNTGRLWAGGVATAVVAALIGLVGVLVVRAVLQVSPRSGAFSDADTVLLCALAAAAALAATGLAHLLLVSTPRPLAYVGWIVGLVTAATVVLPFTGGGSLPIKIATAVIHLVIGVAIASLVTGAASGAVRRPPRY